MPRLNVLGTTVILLSSLLVAGCQATSASNPDRQAAEMAAVRARANETQAAADARKALNARLEELQHRIDALKTDAKPATAKARRELDSRVKALEDQVAQLRADVSNQQSRAEAWDQLKQNTQDAAQKIEQKLDALTQPKK